MGRILSVLLLVVFSFQSLPLSYVYAQTSDNSLIILPPTTFEGRIVYTDSQGQLWILDGATGRATNLMPDAMHSGTKPGETFQSIGYLYPQWSPDGSAILVNRLETHGETTNNTWLVLQYPSLEIKASIVDAAVLPDWSPDGQSIIYSKEPIYNERQLLQETNDIWEYDLVTGLETLLIGPLNMLPHTNPQWSPNGEYIVFSQGEGHDGGAGFIIWEKATTKNFFFPSFKFTSGNPAWLPDNRIVYDESGVLIMPGDGIFIANLDDVINTNPERSIQLIYRDPNVGLWNPVPSPDGEWIAVMAGTQHGRGDALMLISPDGTRQQTIGKYWFNDWSPSGEQMLIGEVVNQTSQTIIYDVPSGEKIIIPEISMSTLDWGTSTSSSPAEVNLDPWIKEKRQLISRLENISINTSYLSVPSIKGLDESQTKKLIEEVERNKGQLTPEQKDGFIRLVIHERSLADHLDMKNNIMASQSEIMVSTGKTFLGLRFAVNSVFENCRGRFLLCSPQVQNQVDKVIWKAIQGIGRVFVQIMTRTTGNEQDATNLWEITLTGIENRLSAGATLKDLVIDSALEASVTQALVLKNLEKDQILLDTALRTVSTSPLSEEDVYVITGSSSRAESMVNEMTNLSRNQHDLIEMRHADFRKGANFAQTTSDLATLGTLSPAAAVSKIIAIASGSAKIVVDLVEATWNGSAIDCMDYLNTMGAQYAFDAQQTPVGCSDRGSFHQSSPGSAVFVSFSAPSYAHPAKTALANISVDYLTALEEFQVAVETGEEEKLQPAMEKFMAEQDKLLYSLDQVEMILSAKETLADEDADFIAETSSFMLESAMVYLAAAQTAIANEEGQQSDALAQFVRGHTQKLNTVQVTLQRLTLPESTPPAAAVTITSVSRTPEGALEVAVHNYSPRPVDGLTATVRTAGGAKATLTLPRLDSGWESAAAIAAPQPDNGVVIVEIWQADRLLDQWIGLPAEVSAEKAATAVEWPLVQPRTFICGALSLAFGVVLIVLFALKRLPGKLLILSLVTVLALFAMSMWGVSAALSRLAPGAGAATPTVNAGTAPSASLGDTPSAISTDPALPTPSAPTVTSSPQPNPVNGSNAPSGGTIPVLVYFGMQGVPIDVELDRYAWFPGDLDNLSAHYSVDTMSSGGRPYIVDVLTQQMVEGIQMQDCHESFNHMVGRYLVATCLLPSAEETYTGRGPLQIWDVNRRALVSTLEAEVGQVLAAPDGNRFLLLSDPPRLFSIDPLQEMPYSQPVENLYAEHIVLSHVKFFFINDNLFQWTDGGPVFVESIADPQVLKQAISVSNHGRFLVYVDATQREVNSDGDVSGMELVVVNRELRQEVSRLSVDDLAGGAVGQVSTAISDDGRRIYLAVEAMDQYTLLVIDNERGQVIHRIGPSSNIIDRLRVIEMPAAIRGTWEWIPLE